ncbi:TBC1 domain member 9 [Allomyces javanicus]|nr:TBC1 domain member 9 [Allomyces javanicus]
MATPRSAAAAALDALDVQVADTAAALHAFTRELQAAMGNIAAAAHTTTALVHVGAQDMADQMALAAQQAAGVVAACDELGARLDELSQVQARLDVPPATHHLPHFLDNIDAQHGIDDGDADNSLQSLRRADQPYALLSVTRPTPRTLVNMPFLAPTLPHAASPVAWVDLASSPYFVLQVRADAKHLLHANAATAVPTAPAPAVPIVAPVVGWLASWWTDNTPASDPAAAALSSSSSTPPSATASRPPSASRGSSVAGPTAPAKGPTVHAIMHSLDHAPAAHRAALLADAVEVAPFRILVKLRALRQRLAIAMADDRDAILADWLHVELELFPRARAWDPHSTDHADMELFDRRLLVLVESVADEAELASNGAEGAERATGAPESTSKPSSVHHLRDRTATARANGPRPDVVARIDTLDLPAPVLDTCTTTLDLDGQLLPGVLALTIHQAVFIEADPGGTLHAGRPVRVCHFVDMLAAPQVVAGAGDFDLDFRDLTAQIPVHWRLFQLPEAVIRAILVLCMHALKNVATFTERRVTDRQARKLVSADLGGASMARSTSSFLSGAASVESFLSGPQNVAGSRSSFVGSTAAMPLLPADEHVLTVPQYDSVEALLAEHQRRKWTTTFRMPMPATWREFRVYMWSGDTTTAASPTDPIRPALSNVPNLPAAGWLLVTDEYLLFDQDEYTMFPKQLVLPWAEVVAIKRQTVPSVTGLLAHVANLVVLGQSSALSQVVLRTRAGASFNLTVQQGLDAVYEVILQRLRQVAMPLMLPLTPTTASDTADKDEILATPLNQLAEFSEMDKDAETVMERQWAALYRDLGTSVGLPNDAVLLAMIIGGISGPPPVPDATSDASPTDAKLVDMPRVLMGIPDRYRAAFWPLLSRCCFNPIDGDTPTLLPPPPSPLDRRDSRARHWSANSDRLSPRSSFDSLSSSIEFRVPPAATSARTGTDPAESYRALVALGPHPAFADEIDKDVGRTMPEHPAFESSGPGIPALRRVLNAFAHRNALGYAQGLNMLTAHFLLAAPEHTAYALLCHVVEVIMPDHFTRTLVGSVVDQRVFEGLVAEHVPRVDARFRALGVGWAALTISWFVAVFLSAIPSVRCTLVVLDLFLLDKERLVFLLALAVVKELEETLVNASDELVVMMELRRFFERFEPTWTGGDAGQLGGLALLQKLVAVAYTEFGSAVQRDLIAGLREMCRFEVTLQMEADFKKAQLRSIEGLAGFSPVEFGRLYATFRHLALTRTQATTGLDADCFARLLATMLNWPHPQPPHPRLAASLGTLVFDAAAALHGVSRLDFPTAARAVHDISKGSASARMRALFAVHDVDQDGWVHADEVEMLLYDLVWVLGGGEEEWDALAAVIARDKVEIGADDVPSAAEFGGGDENEESDLADAVGRVPVDARLVAPVTDLRQSEDGRDRGDAVGDENRVVAALVQFCKTICDPAPSALGARSPSLGSGSLYSLTTTPTPAPATSDTDSDSVDAAPRALLPGVALSYNAYVMAITSNPILVESLRLY